MLAREAMKGLAVVWTAMFLGFSTRAETVEADLVVYGATPAGMAAAVQASRMGLKVVTVEPSGRIGGMTSSGLGMTDIGSKCAFGGLAAAFYGDVGEWYGKRGESVWRFEPKAALAVFEKWERVHRLDIRRRERLDRSAGGVTCLGTRIVSLRTESGNVYRGKMFLDCTYEGDLMAAAGVRYAVGRESNDAYGETLNGVARKLSTNHQMMPDVSAYVREGDPSSGLLPGVERDDGTPDGAADGRVQAYCFRACLTEDPENRIPFKRPVDYREADYELLFRNLAAMRPEELAVPWMCPTLPNRKTDSNNRGGVSLDLIGASAAYPEASYAEREKIEREHLRYQQGLYWTLANHPRVPEEIRREAARWGTCRDEFVGERGDGWQDRLYVREARRLVGAYVMTEQNCRGHRLASKPICLAAYGMDSHNCRRIVDASGCVRNEGNVECWVQDGALIRPYPVDYGAIVPSAGDCSNLLVPVCVSASHIAYGSIRMEPVFFALGQAAGAAAAQALAEGCAVQDVPYEALRARLVAAGQVVDPPVVIENKAFRISLGADGRAKSLIVLSNGEECLEPQSDVPMFSVVQERPFNDETKLHYPNTRTVYPANRLRQDGDDLIVGFAGAPYEARVGVVKKAGYLAFALRGFIRKEGDYGAYLNMDLPPAVSFRVAQLPVKPRRNFGEWLNVMWDESAQVAVLGLDAQVEVWHEERDKACLLQADLHKGRKLSGGAVAVVAAADEERFLNAIADIEEDYNLPRGVKSRRSGRLNESIFWTQELKPTNVDEHIRLARKAGFRMMLVYYPSMIDSDGYLKLGDYDWNADYPNGEADLRKVLAKIRAAGITPGFHTLQTHIGMKSRYVTPVADHRLSLTRRFRLSRPLPREGEVSEIHVEENPVDAVMFPTCRVLQFGGELFWYEAYVTNRPYRFIGVRRGAWETAPAAHPVGERGGTLDLSEYGEAKSCYIDQETSLQDEVAAKIARIVDCGFEFCYFDGSEGVNPPCGINVSLSQLRVAQALKVPLLFTEGAAKSHFGWHLQSGANAFDIFPPERFKESVVRYPLAEAPEMRKNFTRVDFGWWGFFLPSEKSVGTQADMWEFGTSKAAAWDCPVSFQFLDLKDLKRHPRIDDLFETTRRWEEVRERGLLTDEDRRRLRDPKREFHLYLNERSQYELVEIEMLPTPAQASDARAFVFRRNGRTVLACWHVRGAGQLLLRTTKGVVEELPLSSRRYVESDMSVAEMKAAYAAAVMKGTNE